MSEPISKTSLVSVIVTTYNHGPYIEECLESLVSQDCDFPFEILVGEDCSTDDTRDRVLEMAEKHPDVIRPILSERNLGAYGNSRNLTKLAAGKYIALCEGDDYWHRNDKLRRQVEILESDPEIVLVCTDADALFENSGRRIQSIHERNGQWENPPTDLTLALLTRRINIFTCSVCMPRKLRLRIWEENPYEFSREHPMGDIQLWLELSRLGRIVPIRESCATYRVISESASRSRNHRRVFNFQKSALLISEHYTRKLGYGPDIMQQVRMPQFWGLFRTVIEHQDEELRKELQSLVQSRPIVPTSLSQRFAFWVLQDASRMQRFKAFYPAFMAVRKAPAKIRSTARIPRRLLRRPAAQPPPAL